MYCGKGMHPVNQGIVTYGKTFGLHDYDMTFDGNTPSTPNSRIRSLYGTSPYCKSLVAG